MKSELEIAKEVMRGKWGIGTERERRIKKAGYDYNTVQSMVNLMIKTGKPIAEVTVNAKECCGMIVNIKV